MKDYQRGGLFFCGEGIQHEASIFYLCLNFYLRGCLKIILEFLIIAKVAGEDTSQG